MAMTPVHENGDDEEDGDGDDDDDDDDDDDSSDYKNCTSRAASSSGDSKVLA